MWYGNFPVLHGMYLNFREYGIQENYLYMLPIIFIFVVMRYVLIFYYETSIHEQPQKIQMIIEHDLHHDISYSTANVTEDSTGNSLKSPLLSDRNYSANAEFNPIHNYFSDDSEDLVLRRKSSAHQFKGTSGSIPIINIEEEEQRKRQIQKQRKHEIHQKVRWYKLLFQIAKILKW